MKRFIYLLTMCRSKKPVIKQYGVDFWNDFRTTSDKIFKDILPQIPNIGKSIFAVNYNYAPAYIAWYKAMRANGLDHTQADKMMWLMNERMITVVPKFLLHAVGKTYLNTFRKSAESHIERQKCGNCHECDWKIGYRNIDNNSFEIDIYECGFITLAKQFGAEEMLPGICKIDYLIHSLMGNGFKRTKTLGYGDECCDCHYELVGKCLWNPEENFAGKK